MSFDAFFLNGLEWWYTPADILSSVLYMITSGYDMALFKGIKNLPRKHSVEKMNLPKRRTRSDGKFRDWCRAVLNLSDYSVICWFFAVVIIADTYLVNW